MAPTAPPPRVAELARQPLSEVVAHRDRAGRQPGSARVQAAARASPKACRECGHRSPVPPEAARHVPSAPGACRVKKTASAKAFPSERASPHLSQKPLLGLHTAITRSHHDSASHIRQTSYAMPKLKSIICALQAIDSRSPSEIIHDHRLANTEPPKTIISERNGLSVLSIALPEYRK